MISVTRKGRKCGNEPLRKLGLRALPSIDPTPNQDILGERMSLLGSPRPLVKTSYPGNQGLHSPGVILTVLRSQDEDGRVQPPHPPLSTPTKYKGCLRISLKYRAFGVLLDRCAMMRARAI